MGAEKEEKNDAIREEAYRRARERLRVARQARVEEEAQQKTEAEKLEEAEAELQRQEMRKLRAREGQLAAIKRASDRKKQEWVDEEQVSLRTDQEAKERAEMSAARAVKGQQEAEVRLEERKTPLLKLDSDAKNTMQPVFDRYAIKGMLHKVSFIELITRTPPLLDRHLITGGHTHPYTYSHPHT
jgi:hypothetical protein